jgi:hypothetical protein
MSEVKKLIVSRKKMDRHGNEYALIRISSNQQKRPEIRVIKFKKSPKKSKSKKPKIDENENNSSERKAYTTKTSHISNRPKNIGKKEIVKNTLKSKISDSPTNRSSKFTSFISTFNTPSKGKNSFIYNSPKPIIGKNPNLAYLNSPYLNNNYIYSPNSSKNNSEIFKTEYTFANDKYLSEYFKTRECLNNKIMVLSQQNKEYFDKINSLKVKENKLNNIKVKKLKDKQEIKKAKKKTKYETEFKKKLLKQIKELNNYKKFSVKEINDKEKIVKKNNINKENTKIKNMIKNAKKITYQKNRANYLKIRKEEEKLRNKQLRLNLSGNKKIDNHFSYTRIGINQDDNKEIIKLKKQYEKLKQINSEYNSFIKQIKNMDFKRTFTPLNFREFQKSYVSYSRFENLPRKIISNENSPTKNMIGKEYKFNNKNNSVHLS